MGSHGTGKTTLAKALAKRLNFRYIHDVVREEAVRKGFTINENTPPEVQLWLLLRQWELETTTPESWVADKSLFDYLVYGDLILKNEIVKKLIRWFVQRNAHYDIVFYLPIEFLMEEDGIRSVDPKFREEIDRLFRKCLDEFGIKYIELSGSVEERLNQALKYIQK
jgi:nicotinamide riboside kinase